MPLLLEAPQRFGDSQFVTATEIYQQRCPCETSIALYSGDSMECPQCGTPYATIFKGYTA
jgi:hypothetical protein